MRTWHPPVVSRCAVIFLFSVVVAACGADDMNGPLASGAPPDGGYATFDSSVTAGFGATAGDRPTANGGVGAAAGATAGTGGVAGLTGSVTQNPGCNGQVCGGACVDISTNAGNCGACGNACGASERCQQGRCVAVTNDGCTDTPAVGLSLSEIAVYQSVKAPIMQNMTAIMRAQRKVDVVQGRQAVFRIHIAPAAGWAPRQISARVELTNGAAGETKRFFSLLTPSAASRDEDPKSAFLVKVPAEALTADTRYAVTLVECSNRPPVGSTQGARFPSAGVMALEARETGRLRVHIVPLAAENPAPEVSEAALEVYRKRIFAVYPITNLELSVGPPLTSSGTSMCAHLTAIRSRRSADNAPADLYYFGLTEGTSGGQSGCSNALATANSPGKTSVGWHTMSDPDQGERGASTMAHELGHAHGRLHAPCGVQDADRSFPNASADTGVWGHDLRTDTFLPPTRKDMMSYCPNPNRSLAWVSDYTYEALIERVGAVNALVGALAYKKNVQKVSWQTLVVDSLGTHWGEYPLLLEGTPEGLVFTATVYDRAGQAVQSATVYKEELEDGAGGEAYMLTLPQRGPNWYAIEVPGLLAPLVFE